MSEQRGRGSLELAQVVVEGLDVGEDAHGVGLASHDHHVIHLNQPVTACLHPARTHTHKERKAREVSCLQGPQLNNGNGKLLWKDKISYFFLTFQTNNFMYQPKKLIFLIMQLVYGPMQ